MNIAKNFFLPTEQNNWMPRGLSRGAFGFFAALAIGLLLLPTALRYSQLASLTDPLAFASGDVVRLINEARRTNGLRELSPNPVLDRAAAAKVQDMFRTQYFAHYSPTGRSPWDFFRAESYRYVAAGENLALDYGTAAAVHEALMSSPTHRSNILGQAYTEVGVAVGQGILKGRTSVLVAQFFAKPKPAPPIAAAPKPVGPAKSAPKPAEGTPPPAVVQPVVSAAVAPASPGAVLGTEAPLPVGKPGFFERWLSRIAELFRLIFAPDQYVKLVALLTMVVVGLPLVFLFTRLGEVTSGALIRTFVLLLVFGYLAVFGAGEVSASRLTSESVSTVTIELVD